MSHPSLKNTEPIVRQDGRSRTQADPESGVGLKLAFEDLLYKA